MIPIATSGYSFPIRADFLALYFLLLLLVPAGLIHPFHKRDY